MLTLLRSFQPSKNKEQKFQLSKLILNEFSISPREKIGQHKCYCPLLPSFGLNEYFLGLHFSLSIYFQIYLFALFPRSACIRYYHIFLISQSLLRVNSITSSKMEETCIQMAPFTPPGCLLCSGNPMCDVPTCYKSHKIFALNT